MLGDLLLCVLAILHVVNSNVWSWEDKEFSNDEPGPRAGALVAALAHSPSMFAICGGYDSNGQTIAGCGLLDARNNWHFHNVIPPVYISPRSDGTMVSVGNWLILWGGKIPDADALHCGECEIFDTRTWLPSHTHTCGGNVPLPRWGHSASLHQNVWYVFGGALIDGENVAVNDIYTLDLRPSNSTVFSWELVPEPIGKDGLVPIPRYSHSSTVWTDNSGVAKLFIHGGYSFTEKRTLSDLWYISISGFSRLTRWVKVTMDTPIALHGHSLLLHSNHLFLLGGQLPIVGSGMRTLSLDALEHDAFFEMAHSEGWDVPETTGIGSKCPFQASIVAFSSIPATGIESTSHTPSPTPTSHGVLAANHNSHVESPGAFLTVGVFGGLHFTTGSICSSLHVLAEMPSSPSRRPNKVIILIGSISGGLVFAGLVVVFLWYKRSGSPSQRKRANVLGLMEYNENPHAFGQMYTLRQLRQPTHPSRPRAAAPPISIPHKQPIKERVVLLHKEESEPTLVWDLP